uniref:NADH-plastoquinone oxidoreductase subunit J n=1 Tax=Corydalis trisecta TaxID=2682942 RepID=UPI001FAE8D8F|nr:NADH-plastoquinone oxidoreductase subunit J [Corydalis trisecta]ULX45307.1 NADH-plastoquinone oxidoreductase subunit J [Corydalis trisecta]
MSAWLVKHELVHRSLGFDYQGIETLQKKTEYLHSIAVISYVSGYNYLRSQCAYDVAPGGLLASVYHLTRIQYGLDQPEEVCIKVFVPRKHPRIPPRPCITGSKRIYQFQGSIEFIMNSLWIQHIEAFKCLVLELVYLDLVSIIIILRENLENICNMSLIPYSNSIRLNPFLSNRLGQVSWPFNEGNEWELLDYKVSIASNSNLISFHTSQAAASSGLHLQASTKMNKKRVLHHELCTAHST